MREIQDNINLSGEWVPISPETREQQKQNEICNIFEVDVNQLKLVPWLDVHELRNWFYSAKYFNRASELVRNLDDKEGANVKMQIFQKTNNATIAWVDLVSNLLKLTAWEYRDPKQAEQLFWQYQDIKNKLNNAVNLWEDYQRQKSLMEQKLELQKQLDALWKPALDEIQIHVEVPDQWKSQKNKPVMKLEWPYKYIAKMESVYLGLLARATKIATNSREITNAAGDKPVLFFADRFDSFNTQPLDGYAAFVGGVKGVATDAQWSFFEVPGMWTIPHALIASYNQDTPRATFDFSEKYPDVPLIALVDFHNNCPKTSIETAKFLKDNWKDLYAVRLDTSGSLVDEWVLFSNEIMQKYFSPEQIESFRTNYLHNKSQNNVQNNSLLSRDDLSKLKEKGLTWVCGELVNLVRQQLDEAWFEDVKIIVSWWFNKEKINYFEENWIPADWYWVGSSILANTYVSDNGDFTADVVKVNNQDMAKVGRKEI